ncbi:hypothetical protein DM860_017673 [Cuscuta australis]|uniref:RING-type domain-containing protein n=1 Tax=Cuscuta australis TaxID=267555 RepID=A0A328D6R4_9ASTE|nr:hypothetical protein DM860_017673 [Cuscuta australis]
MASGTKSESRANKRRETLERPLPSKEAAVQGKTKIENLEREDEGGESARCCGICLVESGQGQSTIQGCIGSCDHFFCFLCITGWSKVESRSPTCKLRCSAIRRPANPSERLVPVPHRDQV